MNLLATLLLFAIVPHDLTIVAETLDCAESNAVWREDFDSRRLEEDQWIFYRDSEVIAWGWDRNCSVSYHPNRIYITNGRRVRVLRPLAIIGTVSNYGREAKERGWLPECRRKGLAK